MLRRYRSRHHGEGTRLSPSKGHCGLGLARNGPATVALNLLAGPASSRTNHCPGATRTDIVGITAAAGWLRIPCTKAAGRVIDVGIAEAEGGVASAAGMAYEAHPVVALYAVPEPRFRPASHGHCCTRRASLVMIEAGIAGAVGASTTGVWNICDVLADPGAASQPPATRTRCAASAKRSTLMTRPPSCAAGCSA